MVQVMAVALSALFAMALGSYRGVAGWEMLSGWERFVILGELMLIAAASMWTPRPAWLITLVATALMWVSYANLYEPRFFFQFGFNGLACVVRSLPAAAATIVMMLVLVQIGRWKGSATSITLLAACSAILAQTLSCSITESRHAAWFHAGQFVFFTGPLLVLRLFR